MTAQAVIDIFPCMAVTREWLLKSIEAKRNELGLSRRKFAETAGISYQGINDFYYGKAQILGGNNLVAALKFLEARPKSSSKTKKAPRYYAGAGEYFYPSSEAGDWIDIPASLKDDDYIAFEVRGRSMEPAMREGDTVFCRWTFDYIEPEAIGNRAVVLCDDDRVLIKELRRAETKGLYDLISLNGHPPEYNVRIKAAAKILDVRFK